MAGINQLESMKVLKAVVETGSFSAAAKRLNMSAAWVSKSIERLEAQLSTTLFHRSTRHMQITAEGELCYRQGCSLLADWQKLQDDLCQTTQTPSGKLKICAPMTWGLLTLSPLLPEFMARYPEISLDLVLSDQHINIIEEGFDLVLRLTYELADSSLLCRPITRYPRTLCASAEYIARCGAPQNPMELNQYASLVYAQPGISEKWRLFKGTKPFELYLTPKLRSNNSKLLMDALLAGQGIGLMPSFLVQASLDSGQLQALLPGYHAEQLTLYSLRPGHRRKAQALSLFHDFLFEKLSTHGENHKV